MSGIGHRAVEQHDFRVGENPGLLDDAFAGDRRADLPHGSKEIPSDALRALQQRKTAKAQVQGAGALRDAHGDSRALNAERRESPMAINQGKGNEDVQDVHDDHGIHRRFRVPGALED